MRVLLSMEGRYNRTKYFWIGLAISIGVSVAAGVIQLAVEAASGDPNIAAVLGTSMYILGAVIAAFPVIKRLHDLARPSSHYWLLLIPFYNLYLALVLLFKKGTPGPNQYGPDPLGPVMA
jgi:uncharacterized membrane protein YhaH (DUF805 family)